MKCVNFLLPVILCQIQHGTVVTVKSFHHTEYIYLFYFQISNAITQYSGDIFLFSVKSQNLCQCFSFKVSDRSGSQSLVQINHLGFFAPVTNLQHTRGRSHEATKNIPNITKMTDIYIVYIDVYANTRR